MPLGEAYPLRLNRGEATEATRRGARPSTAVRAAVTALAGSLAVRRVIAYADAYTSVQNSRRVAEQRN